MANKKKDVVLVTGSSGCLGQQIVKLLQERDDNVAEIRVFDFKPYKNYLEHSEEKPIVEFVGDLRNKFRLLEACEGVDCVIHVAAVMDLRLIPNRKHMHSVNVEGTRDVIECCIAKNVPRLIYCSSTDMVCGTEHIFYATESTTPIPTSFMIGPYGESKCLAEDLVLKASGSLLKNGEGKLRTVSLRPTPFYGEDDLHFFYKMLQYAKRTGGYYYRVRSLDERLQITYVGNVAWAFIKAKEKLAVDETISGEAFFITDDTPIIDVHEHLEPFLEARGCHISAFIIPYWFAWILLSIVCFCIKFINIFWPFEVDVPSVNMLNYMCSTFFYNRSKATLRLDYQPIYTPEEAKERSLPYYASVIV